MASTGDPDDGLSVAFIEYKQNERNDEDRCRENDSQKCPQFHCFRFNHTRLKAA